MRILFLTDNFPPEFNAPATRTYEHCKEWVRNGTQVTVITCFPNFPQGIIYPSFKNRLRQVEYIDGIKVIRVWSFIAPNRGAIKRTLDFISFGINSFLVGLWEKADLIIATSPQFFTAISGCALGILRRKRWVMEVRDIWPESIKAVGALKSKWIISALEKIELFLYRSAWKVVVVTDSFKNNLISRGIEKTKVYVIKNGVDLSIYRPKSKNSSLVKKLGLENKFIIGYIGTHGLSHGLDFIIRSIKKLNDNSFHFLFIGDGATKENIIKLTNTLSIKSITFIDPVSKLEIPEFLSILDVSLVPLRKTSTFESVIPSKIFESVAMNVPILLGVSGEAQAIIKSYNAGVYFEPENETDFIEKLIQIRNEILNGNPFTEGCHQMAKDFDRKNLAIKMLQIIS